MMLVKSRENHPKVITMGHLL